MKKHFLFSLTVACMLSVSACDEHPLADIPSEAPDVIDVPVDDTETDVDSIGVGSANDEFSADSIEVSLMNPDLLWSDNPARKTAVVLRIVAPSRRRISMSLTYATDTAGRIELAHCVYPCDPICDTLQFNSPFTSPGIYRSKFADEESGKVLADVFTAMRPSEIRYNYNPPADLRQFWQTTVDRLAEIDPCYTVEEDTSLSGSRRAVYNVTMRSWEGDTVRGILCMPRGNGKYPVKVYYHSYGAAPWSVNADAAADRIDFYATVRGQSLNLGSNRFDNWILYGLESPETYYYRGAYMDALRAVDFVRQLPKADTRRIYLTGASQGGGLAAAAAALDGHVAAVALAIPFLSDFADQFRIGTWPGNSLHNEAQRLGLSEQQLLHNLSYFDISNLAPMIGCPLLMGVGLQDRIAPAVTEFAFFNNLSVERRYIIYPLHEHGVGYDWHQSADAFLTNYSCPE